MVCLVPSIVIMLIQNAAVIFGSEVYVLLQFWKSGRGTGGTMESFFAGLTSTGFLMSVSMGYAVAGIVVFALWYKHIRENQDEFIFKDSLKGYGIRMYAGILLFAVSAQFVCEYLITILAKMMPEWLEMYSDLMAGMEITGNNSDILVVAYIIILGPICEELCFRGVTFSLCRRVMSFSSANLVQALLFGGMHANPLQSIYAFAFGWLLGHIYMETGNLIITVIVHILFNGAGMCLANYIGVGATPVSFFIVLLVSMCMVYYSFLLIRREASASPSDE